MSGSGPGSGPPAASEARGGLAGSRTRTFVIQSTFGNPRERRSRKNRPCDACRRRKTACVITTGPPCLYCENRGLVCESSSIAIPKRRRDLHSHEAAIRRHSTPQALASPETALSLNETVIDHGPSPQEQSTVKSSLSSRCEVNELLTPMTIQESPRIVSPMGPYGLPQAQDDPRLTAQAPAALVHQNLADAGNPSYENLDRRRTVDERSPSLTSLGVHGSTQSLDDVPGRTTYYLGLTSEQDAFLLDSFRYGILNERFTTDANVLQVHPGSGMLDDRPIHFLSLEIGHPEHVNRAKRAASDAIESKVRPYGENLVRLFFRHVHPVLPVVSKVRFLHRYHSDKDSLPACLRGAIYALACVFWDFDMALRGTSCPFTQHELVDHAHTALRREIENPKLFVVQACLLLIHVLPPAIDTMEAPTTWTLAAQATASAQTIGLHQDSSRWDLEASEKKLRRKIWWAVFLTDCWSSICLGNPPHIGATTFNTTPPTMEDMRTDEDVPEELRYLVEPPDINFEVAAGARFIEMINIARHLRTVLDCSYQVNTRTMTIHERKTAQEGLFTAQAKLQDWPSLLPLCLVIKSSQRPRPPLTCYNCPLHLSYYAALVLLYRALMFPATRAAKSDPYSSLRRWFPAALLDFEAFVAFFASVNVQDLMGFWGRRTYSDPSLQDSPFHLKTLESCNHLTRVLLDARSQLILCGNFLIYLFLLASERQDIERAYRLLESFHQSIHELSKDDSLQAKTFLRAATVRIDSFFTQAAQIMRNGREVHVASVHDPSP